MIFLELVLQNFGPYVGNQIINLSPSQGDNKESPIVLFGGMNGGGKTTLMDAMRLALYGGRAQCSTRGNLSYSDFLAQSFNRHASPTDEAKVELTFEHIDHQELVRLKVVRRWEKEPKEGKDTLSVLIYSSHQDDWWPDKSLVSTWDEYIENLLPLGISNLFLFDGEQVKELAEVETPPELVMDAIKSLLGLELATKLSQDLEILVSRKRKEMAQEKDAVSLDNLEKTYQSLSQEVEKISQELVQLKEQLVKAEAKEKHARSKFIAEGGRSAHDRDNLTAQYDKLHQEIAQAQQDLVKLAGAELPLVLILPLLNQAYGQGLRETQQQQAKITVDVLQERSDRLLHYLEQLSLSARQLKQIKDFINAENQTWQGQAQEADRAWLNIDEKSLHKLDMLLKYQIQNTVDKAEIKQAELAKLEAELEQLERQIAVAASPEISEKLEKQMALAQKEIVQISSTIAMTEQRQADLQKELAKTYKELANYTDTYLKQRSVKHIIKSCAEVQETLKVFQHKLTLKKLNKLETEVTNCFRYLLRKNDLVHRVTIDTDTFSLSLYDPRGHLLPKNRLSAGEKQLLAIAFLWGLARVSGRHLPVAIDTPLGRLDSSHREHLIERYFPAASHQVILLSTDTEIQQFEVNKLRELEAINRSYLLEYDPETQTTIVKPGYFW